MLGWVAKNAGVISKDHTLRITATGRQPFLANANIGVEGPVQVRLQFARQRMGKGVCNGALRIRKGFLRPASELSHQWRRMARIGCAAERERTASTPALSCLPRRSRLTWTGSN